MTSQTVSCRSCPHTNKDHSIYSKECLFDPCPCKQHNAGEKLDIMQVKCHTPGGSGLFMRDRPARGQPQNETEEKD